MSTAKAQRFLLERFNASGTVLLALLLDAGGSWADGADAEGRSVLLVGAHALRALPAGEEAVATVLASLSDGRVPDGVNVVAYAPKASEAFAAIVDDADVDEVLMDGPRGTGKTQVVPGALAALAELRVRAGLPLPLRVLWLHDTMLAAHMKTARSLQEPLWSGAWTLRDGVTVAVFTLGGVEMVTADFVPTEDVNAAERLRAAAHVVVVEEPVASLSEGGIDVGRFQLALSSLHRLPSHRRVAILSTNPGSPEHWVYTRFISPGRPRCLRVQIPASDRLTPSEETALVDSFRDTPDLQRRLALGEWSGLLLGPQVAMGYNPATHVAPHPLAIDPYAEVWVGWDSGGGAHCHATIIGQRLGSEVRIFACLVSEDTGLKQHLEHRVLPWLSRCMPRFLDHRTGVSERRLLHRYDPTMDTDSGDDIAVNAVRRVRSVMGGSFRPGPVHWPERIGALLALLNQGNGRGGMALQIDPGPDTALLRRALAGEWYYAVTRGGQVVRDLPAKPNHPHEDVGDALCYFAGGVVGQLEREARDDRRPARSTYATGSMAHGRGR